MAARVRAGCAQLDLGQFPPVANLRPEQDHPERYHVAVDVGRVRRVLLRIAADVQEFARVRAASRISTKSPSTPMRAPSAAGASPKRR